MKKLKQLNHTFEKVDSPEIAYILGFIYADGCIIESPHYKMTIALAHIDIEHLKNIGKILSDEIKVKNYEKQCSFSISRKEVIKNLMNLGVIQNKTGTIMSIPNMPKEFIRDFIRGYFDGDGCYVTDRSYVYFNICSANKNILEEFKDVFKEYKIKSSINIDTTRKIGDKQMIQGLLCNINYLKFNLNIKKKNSIINLYDFLYKDATIYLERKEKIIKNYINTKSQKISRDLEFITYEGQTKSIEEWSKELNISANTLKWRIFKSGWTLEQALSLKLNEEIINKNYKYGEKHPNSKLTNQQVLEIYNNPNSSNDISKIYNISKSTVDYIRNGKNYSSVTKHLPRVKLIKNTIPKKYRNDSIRL